MSITKLNNLSISAVTALPSGVGGKVLQVVTATDSTHRNTTSISFVTASNTLSVSITPSSASNKIFITANSTIVNTSGNGLVFATIFRNSTNIGDANNGMAVGNSVPEITHIDHPMCMTILDSPSTTSAITYQVYIRSDDIGTSAQINGRSAKPCKGTITAFEIKG